MIVFTEYQFGQIDDWKFDTVIQKNFGPLKSTQGDVDCIYLMWFFFVQGKTDFANYLKLNFTLTFYGHLCNKTAVNFWSTDNFGSSVCLTFLWIFNNAMLNTLNFFTWKWVIITLGWLLVKRLPLKYMSPRCFRRNPFLLLDMLISQNPMVVSKKYKNIIQSWI